MEGANNINNFDLTAEDIQKFKQFLSMLPGSNNLKTISIEDFEIEYLKFIKNNYSKSYLVSVELSFKHLKKYFSLIKPINEIDLKLAENFISYLQNKVNKGWRVYYRNLKAAFNKAISWKYIYKNPFSEIKLPKKQKLPPVYITRDQLEMICAKTQKETIKNFFRFAFNTGLRRAEQTNLTWKDVDLQNKIITIGSETFTTKSRKQRKIPLNQESFDILIKHYPKIFKTGRNYVFCKKNRTPYSGDRVSTIFKEACKAARIDERICYHSLRHSFASNLAQKGVSLYIVKELLGHGSIQMTEIYSHLSFDNLRNAVEKIDAADKAADEKMLREIS